VALSSVSSKQYTYDTFSKPSESQSFDHKFQGGKDRILVVKCSVYGFTSEVH